MKRQSLHSQAYAIPNPDVSGANLGKIMKKIFLHQHIGYLDDATALSQD